jgi:hypothetical protein
VLLDVQLHRRQRAVRVMMAMMVPSQHEEIDYLTPKGLSIKTHIPGKVAVLALLNILTKDNLHKIPVKSFQRKKLKLFSGFIAIFQSGFSQNRLPYIARLGSQLNPIVCNGDEERTWQRSQKQPTVKRSWTPPKAPTAPSAASRPAS